MSEISLLLSSRNSKDRLASTEMFETRLSLRSRLYSCVNSASGERSETRLFPSLRTPSDGNSASGERSTTWLLSSQSFSKASNCAKGERSEMSWEMRRSSVALTANSMPFRSAMVPCRSPRLLMVLSVAIWPWVIAASPSTPSAAPNMARSVSSGMSTTACGRAARAAEAFATTPVLTSDRARIWKYHLRPLVRSATVCCDTPLATGDQSPKAPQLVPWRTS